MKNSLFLVLILFSITICILGCKPKSDNPSVYDDNDIVGKWYGTTVVSDYVDYEMYINLNEFGQAEVEVGYNWYGHSGNISYIGHFTYFTGRLIVVDNDGEELCMKITKSSKSMIQVYIAEFLEDDELTIELSRLELPK